MHREPGVAPGPVRTRLDPGSPLVRAGVETLLGPHQHRVRLLPPTASEVPQVVLFELRHHVGPRVFGSRDTPLVALSWDDTPETRRRARELGAAWVLSVNVGGQTLVETLEAAHRGAPRNGAAPAALDGDPLSMRESEVISLICRGLSNEDIAAHLALSINSVKTYIRTAYRKMGVRSRAQAVIWGLAHGL